MSRIYLPLKDQEFSNSLTKESNFQIDSIEIEDHLKLKLKFDQIQKISFGFFVKESINYVVIYAFQRLLSLVILGLYGLSGHSNLIGKIGFTMEFLNCIFSGMRDFQNNISIICGPHYSKKNFFQYRVERNKLIMLNIFFFSLMMLVWFFLESIYNLLGVEEKNMTDILFFSKLYILNYGPMMAFCHFLKGLFYK